MFPSHNILVFVDTKKQDAADHLRAIRKRDSNPATAWRSFVKKTRAEIQEAHGSGASGIEITAWRAAMVDVLLADAFEHFRETSGASKRIKSETPFTIIASGGYGRAELSPGSDIDLQFLVPESSSRRIKPEVKEMVSAISTSLFDLGFNVSYPIRSIKEACKFANEDHQTKTTLLDARIIVGDEALFETFENTFFDSCIRKQEMSYLAERSRDIRRRHKKFGDTIHLQEPNVKEGCGGLRDYHNLVWVLWVLKKSRDLSGLLKDGRLSQIAYDEIEEAYLFLLRVRTELHYVQKGKQSDILTLRLQGLVANSFQYPGSNVIHRSENFMRSYYRHTRNLWHHSTSLMQSFELEVGEPESSRGPLLSFLGQAAPEEEAFDGFFSRGGLIYPESETIFAEDPKRLMRFFLHTQRRQLRTSPQIRRLFKQNWHLIDGNFRRNKANRDTWEEILQNRGQVAHILRRMHRNGFLGRYLPEFGKLTDLVQHEFFHRYTADEHTLRCIDMLDSLVHSEDPKTAHFRKIFQDIEDPVALYVALLMHDTGRAEEVRKHEDGSALLASQVCSRLRYGGDRLKLITFLVDQHLTFWRTATTKDIGDPNTIAEFARTVRSRRWMDILHLFTYVDSKGTNDEAWNGWKASLMRQLSNSTAAFFEDRSRFDSEFNPDTEETKKIVHSKLPESYQEEIEAHFDRMPKRYFGHREPSSIIRHIKLFHRFLKKLHRVAPDALVPVVGWDHRTEEGYTVIEVVGWNRRALLYKVAGALAARNITVLAADIFTRDDNLVLDHFRVSTPTFNAISSKRDIERIEKLIEKEFSVAVAEDKDVPSLDSLVEKAAQPSITDPAPYPYDIPKRVILSNKDHPVATVLEIQAQDRIGLLYDIFRILAEFGIDVINARISTQAGAAIDRFWIVDTDSSTKIEDAEQLSKLESAIGECLNQATPAQ
ncbi:MAG: [protein-PII] uridylyltransferase [Verrucomicrobiota bacterium]